MNRKVTFIKIFIFVFVMLNSLFVVPYTLPFVQAHSQTQIIEITEDGFMPNEITIDADSIILFLNKDKGDRWPASNPHPIHSLYPEFDPKQPVESGKSWVFKPKRLGEWKYHDHLNPHQRGVITVVAEASGQDTLNWMQNLKNAMQGFFTNLKNLFEPKFNLESGQFIKSSPDEQITRLKKYASSQGAEKTWQFVKDTYKGHSGSSGNIHDLAHLSGGLLFEMTGFEGLGKCSVDFAFGCFHGFLDSAFKKNLDHLLDAKDACSELGPGLSGPVASCIHGIGHGVASFYSVSDLKKALATCRKLESGSQYCFDGVFMEFARNAPESYIKKDDPLYPCNELEKQYGFAYSSACGRNQPSLLMSRFKMSFEQVIPVCLSSDSTPFKQSCFDSLGFSLASSGESRKIIQGCQMMGSADYIKRCIKSAAGELVFQDVPGWEQKSKEVCESFPDDTKECLSYVNKLVSDYQRVRK